MVQHAVDYVDLDVDMCKFLFCGIADNYVWKSLRSLMTTETQSAAVDLTYNCVT